MNSMESIEHTVLLDEQDGHWQPACTCSWRGEWSATREAAQMTGRGHKTVTSPEARDIHAAAQQADPDHDRGSCWCCCVDCDFDAEGVWANDKAVGIKSVV